MSSVVDGPQAGGTGGGEPSLPTVDSPPGAGYAFDAETLAATIRQWEELRDEIEADRLALRANMVAVQPPSFDPPATRYVAAVAHFIDAAIEHSHALKAYTQLHVERLQKATKEYRESDEEAGGTIEDISPDDDPLHR